MTRAQFNKIFYDKYFSQCFRDRKVSEFQELKQGNMFVVEYEAKFTKLARFTPHMVDTDYKKAQKFEGGLDLDVFDRVGVLKLPTYVDVLDRALMTEANLAAKKQVKTLTTEWRGKRSGYGFRKGRSFVNNKKQKTGLLVAQIDHVVRDCSLGSDNANCPTTSLAGSTSVARTNTRANTGRETLRQGRVFALVPGDMQNTEAVVSDWLTKYCATIDCVNEIVVFRPPGMLEFVFAGNGVIPLPYLISFVKPRKLLRKKYRGYLCCVLTVTSDNSTVDCSK
ncbi:uncharacterized protein LOC114313751 [Camellia sinensis]|uniref:uncharacterized protein LOC114313751 n=1 Tax=Camellia sinensis TaxID=4442 RepID=UPI0010369F1C|nr:uncharacterized protein LOC114313751 [Camellia sinensis]